MVDKEVKEVKEFLSVEEAIPIVEEEITPVDERWEPRPQLGAPARADDNHDFAVELVTLSPTQRKILGLAPSARPERRHTSLLPLACPSVCWSAAAQQVAQVGARTLARLSQLVRWLSLTGERKEVRT